MTGLRSVLKVIGRAIRRVLDGLWRALSIELTAKGARFSEREAEASLASDQVLTERVASLERTLVDQRLEGEEIAREANEGLRDFRVDLAVLRARFEEIERKVG